MRRFIYAAITSLIMLLTLSACSKTPTQTDSYTLYLVRHAEKALDKSKDPDLTEQGQQRASRLAALLASEGLLDIYSSDYVRTRETAAPLAAHLGVDITLYDPRDLGGLTQDLKTRGRSALVVGHSNTTPQLAEMLGANPGAPIIEATEYDRLYKITLRDGQLMSEDIIRY